MFDNVTPVEVIDNEGPSSLLDAELIDVKDGAGVEVTDNKEVCSLLDIILVDLSDSEDIVTVLVGVTDVADVTSLLIDTGLRVVIVGIKFSSLLDVAMV